VVVLKKICNGKEDGSMTILAYAHIVFCPRCGLHGHVVFSDGERGVECTYIEDFTREIAEALFKKKVCEEEVQILREELSKSNVPSAEFVRKVSTIVSQFFESGVAEKEMERCPSSRILH
jgi:hypothetical protein